MNWRGQSLTDIRTIIELISATSTRTGLTVQAVYDSNWYPKGQKISDAELKGLPLTTSAWHPPPRTSTCAIRCPGSSANSAAAPSMPGSTDSVMRSCNSGNNPFNSSCVSASPFCV